MVSPHNHSIDFVPLTTEQGVLPGSIIDNLNGRTLVIWGCGHLGRALAGVFRRIAHRECRIVFCDRRRAMWGSVVDDVPVLPPAECIVEICRGGAFCVAAVAAGGDAVAATLTELGACPERDFLAYRRISRPEAYVSAAGMADGTMRYLDAAAFRAVVEKLLRDIPHVMQVSIVGEPDAFAHPELAQLIAAARGRVATSVAGRLHSADIGRLERLAEVGPNLLALRTALPGESMEMANVRSVLEATSRLRDRYGHKTEFRIIHVKRRTPDDGESRAILERLCAELHLVLVHTDGYVEPYDLLLTEQGEGDDGAELRTQKGELAWNLEAGLAAALSERGRPCLSQRIFPVIGPDLTVNVCHLYRSGRVADSFLDTPYEDLLAMRHESAHCRVCQVHGLHRLDIDVLRRRHPNTCFDRAM